MRQTTSLILAACFALVSTSAAWSQDETREVKARDMTLKVPASWKQQPPASRLRLTQFAVPPVEGDKQPAELSVFSFGAGGSVAENVRRWISQFEQEGRKFKGTTGKSPQGPYVLVELSGTYKKPDGPPILGRTVPMPDARMLVAMIMVKDRPYFVKLVGSDKTVAANTKAFRTAIGASDKEEPLKLDES